MCTSSIRCMHTRHMCRKQCRDVAHWWILPYFTPMCIRHFFCMRIIAPRLHSLFWSLVYEFKLYFTGTNAAMHELCSDELTRASGMKPVRSVPARATTRSAQRGRSKPMPELVHATRQLPPLQSNPHQCRNPASTELGL